MKMYVEVEVSSTILDFYSMLKLMVSLKPRPLCPGELGRCALGIVLDAVEMRKISVCPARN
jgi:hypothetical protein